MVVADAVIHGDRERLLGFDAVEHPVALQLGGSDPAKLAEAARIGAGFGYDEINLNCGCPSDRVQSGTFGACLMQTPRLVADCVAAMKAAVAVPVTVKCRLGVDDQDIETALDDLAGMVFEAGADALWVHARKAWLQGLSPKENREIPPLDYSRVLSAEAGLAGPIHRHQWRHRDARRGGRPSRPCRRRDDRPRRLPYAVHACTVSMRCLRATRPAPFDAGAVIAAMADHAGRHIAAGGRLSHVTRHMVGLFHGHARRAALPADPVHRCQSARGRSGGDPARLCRRRRPMTEPGSLMNALVTMGGGQIAGFAAAIAAAGVVSGLLAGVFGIGGGAVLVPVFYQVFGLLGVDESVRMHVSVGSSLAIIVPTSLRSFTAHKARGAVDMDLLKSFLVPVPAGVIAARSLPR